MKKSTADSLAYQMALARFPNSEISLNAAGATRLSEFIQTLSKEFQNTLDDFDEDTLKRFQNLSK